MKAITAVVVSLVSALTGCATDSAESEPEADPPVSDGEPGDRVVTRIEIDWDNTLVEEIARRDNVNLEDVAAVQIRTGGTFIAAGGTEVAIAVGAGSRNGHPSENYGSWSWDNPSIDSDDYTSGFCGSWESIRTSQGLICRAPGDPSSEQRTTWYYRQLEQFDVTSNGSEFDFYVTAYDTSKAEILCERVVVTDSSVGSGAPSVAHPACR